MENVVNLLAAAGVKPEDVVKTTVFIKDMNDFAKVNAVYAEYFKTDCPARACVEVARLPKAVSYTHLDVYKRQVSMSITDGW